MEIGQAASLFTRLTIGDGLVTQVPAFLISLAAGLLVTRSSGNVNLPVQFISQLFSRPQALAVTAGFLGLLIFTNLPALPLLGIGGSCAVLAVVLSRRQRDADEVARQTATAEAKKPREERVEDYLAVDPMEVEIGVSLIRLADPKRGGDLLERIQRVRQHVASQMGLIMPKVRIRDNMRLEGNQYRIKIADIPVAEGKLYPGMLLAIETAAATGQLNGLATRDPAFDTPATWIEPATRDQAEMLGYSVVEPISVLATHLTEVVRRHADEILSRDATKHLIDELKKTSPAVVDELIPAQMKLADVQQILQLLLREQVSIRQLAPILETLGEYAPRTKDPVLLTDYVRRRVARAICAQYRDKENRLYVVTLDPELEDRIAAGLEHHERGLAVRLSPQAIDGICRLIDHELKNPAMDHRPQIVLVSPQIRAGLKQLTAAQLPRLVVLSYDEITRDTQLESTALVEDMAGVR
jgi:flagellar biosynthesis protein FlhA